MNTTDEPLWDDANAPAGESVRARRVTPLTTPDAVLREVQAAYRRRVRGQSTAAELDAEVAALRLALELLDRGAEPRALISPAPQVQAPPRIDEALAAAVSAAEADAYRDRFPAPPRPSLSIIPGKGATK